MSLGEIDGVLGYCLVPLDLAYSKTEAGWTKDIHFVAGMINEAIITRDTLGNFIKQSCPHPELLPTVEKNSALVCAELDEA